MIYNEIRKRRYTHEKRVSYQDCNEPNSMYPRPILNTFLNPGLWRWTAWLLYFLPVWPWTSYLPCLCLRVHIYKMGTIPVPPHSAVCSKGGSLWKLSGQCLDTGQPLTLLCCCWAHGSVRATLWVQTPLSRGEQKRKAAVKVLLGLFEPEVTLCLRRPRG